MSVTIAYEPPGDVLNELYLKPLNMKAGSLASKLNVPRTRIERIVKGTTPITPDTALRLSRFFSTTPQYWLNLQTNYDLSWMADEMEPALSKIEALEHA
jgi:addiction module HigA family antidote